jgi:hypothetical protein
VLELAAGPRVLLRDQLHEVLAQRDAVCAVVAREAGVAALAVGSHVADGGDGPDIVVVGLAAPGRDGRVVHGAAEPEVHLRGEGQCSLASLGNLDVELQLVHDGPHARHAPRALARLVRLQTIRNVLKEK